MLWLLAVCSMLARWWRAEVVALRLLVSVWRAAEYRPRFDRTLERVAWQSLDAGFDDDLAEPVLLPRFGVVAGACRALWLLRRERARLVAEHDRLGWGGSAWTAGIYVPVVSSRDFAPRRPDFGSVGVVSDDDIPF